MNFDKPDYTNKLAAGAAFGARFDRSREIPGALTRAGAEYVKRGKVKFQFIDSPASGTSELTGAVQCSFGIVHHPTMTVVRRSGKLLVERHRCGCREGLRGDFCAHCAALLAARFDGLEARLPEDEENLSDADLKGIRIRLGTQRKSREPIFWTPEDSERVSTPNLAVIGGADSGNTQVMKSITVQFLRQRSALSGAHGVLILDWMGDYDESKTDFLEATGARICRLQKLPLDPFSLRRLERKPQLHVHTAMAFADTLTRAYDLGPLQKSTLVQSVVAAYGARGITSDPLTWNLPTPTFDDVYQEYCSRPQAQRSDALSQVMDSIVAFELFDSELSERTTLSDMLKGVVVMDMSGYPRELQRFAAGVMLEQFYGQMCGSGRSCSGDVTKMLLIDEADDLLDMGCPALEGMLHRSREYGLSVVLAARSPLHFCDSTFDWWKVIRTWVIHNAEELFRPELETLLQREAVDMERLYQTVKHQTKLQSLIRIGAEEPLAAEDLPFYEIFRDRNESYLKEQRTEVRQLPLEGMPLLDTAHLDAVDIPDEDPAAPMAELKTL